MCQFITQPEDQTGFPGSVTFMNKVAVQCSESQSNACNLKIDNGTGNEQGLDLTQGVGVSQANGTTTYTFSSPGIPADYPAGSCYLNFYLNGAVTASNMFNLKYYGAASKP